MDWKSVLLSAGMPGGFLTGKHGPCPFCGGTDRWRWDNKNQSGSGICNQCGAYNGAQLVAKWNNMDVKQDWHDVNELILECGGAVDGYTPRADFQSGVTRPAAASPEKKSVKPQDVPAGVPDTKQLSTLDAFINARVGPVVGRWRYVQQNGDFAFEICRVETPKGKAFKPVAWFVDATGADWQVKGMPGLKPLYRADKLADAKKVIVVEGEKAADAGQSLWSDYVVTTWANGAGAVAKTDWSVLRHAETVLIIPDNDPAGIKAALAVRAAIGGVARGEVRIVELPQGLPEKWDVADAWPEGVTPSQFVAPQEDNTLDVDDEGRARNNIGNAEKMIRREVPARWNEFKLECEVKMDGGQWEPLEDHHAKRLAGQWETRLLFSYAAPDKIHAAIENVARKNPYHPAREYLQSLKYTGRLDPRDHVQTWFPVVLGAEDSPEYSPEYVKRCAEIFGVGAVARVMQPGCEMHSVIVLEGKQGIGKGTFLKAIVPVNDWFTESFPTPGGDNKDAIIAMKGRWLIEFGELAGLQKRTVEEVKRFITTSTDRCRLPYHRNETSLPRQCIFVGTTNVDNYLTDPTGARRFLPFPCTEVRTSMLTKEQVDNFWAACYMLYQQGVTWQVDREWAIQYAEPMQASRTAKDIVTMERLEMYLTHTPKQADKHMGWEWELRKAELTEIAIQEFITTFNNVAPGSTMAQRGVEVCLKSMGWKPGGQRTFPDGRRMRVWVKA